MSDAKTPRQQHSRAVLPPADSGSEARTHASASTRPSKSVFGKRWVKGQSGNPRGYSEGRRAVDAKLQRWAKPYVKSAIKTFHEICSDPKQPPEARIKAAGELVAIHRGGRLPTTQEVVGDASAPVSVAVSQAEGPTISGKDALAKATNVYLAFVAGQLTGEETGEALDQAAAEAAVERAAQEAEERASRDSEATVVTAAPKLTPVPAPARVAPPPLPLPAPRGEDSA
jgi:hypothetical protein